MNSIRFWIIFFSLLSNAAVLSAENLPFSFVNNKIKLIASRSARDGRSSIKLDIKAPDRTDVRITEAHNPARLIFDFKNSRITRNRDFPITDSPSVRNIRFGVHPNHFRLVVEFKSKNIPTVSYSESGNWFTVILAETESDSEAQAPAPWETEGRELKFSAALWNKTSVDTRDDLDSEQKELNSLEFRPELSYLHDSNFDATVSVRAKVLSEFNNNIDYRDENVDEVRLWNAYFSYNQDWYSVKVGSQIVTWGKADEISPLDNVNPEDLRDGPVRRRNERKIPVPMINAELFARGDRLQFLFIPLHQRSRVDYFGTDWAIAGSSIGSLNIQEEYPSNSLDNSEYGVRYTSDAASVDYSLSFLSVLNDLPSLKSINLPSPFVANAQDISMAELVGLASAGNVPLGIEYNRRGILGFDFETVLDNVGLRGDFAYTSKEDFINSQLQASRHSTYRYTIGADYSSSADFYINMQYLQTIIADYDDLLFNEEVQNGIFAEVSQEFSNNEYKLGFRTLYGAPQRQYYYNPYLQFKHWDNFNFELGADFLGGEESSLLGFYQTNDAYYLILSAYY